MEHRHIIKCNTTAKLHASIVNQSLLTPWVALTTEDNKVHFNSVANLLKDYVDLDLPSGIHWAKYNLGAHSESDYGLYYQFGATEGFTDSSNSTWDTCPFNNESETYNEHYFQEVISDVVDGNFQLKRENDASYKDTDGIGYLPTEKDFNELCDYTIHTWEQINGIWGRKFTSLQDYSKYIFIPSAGCMYKGKQYGKDEYGLLWTSNLQNPTYSHAAVFVTSENENETGFQERLLAIPLRSVYIKK